MTETASTVALRTLPEAHFTCHGCGDCCRDFNFGPVEPEILAGLEAASIGELWPAAAEQPWYELRTDEDGTEGAYLTTIDGACIFLREDNLCAIHTTLGAAAKPWFCRMFPFVTIAEPDAVSFAIRRLCSSWHLSHVDGDPMEAHVPDILSFIDRTPPRIFDPPRIELLPGVAVAGTSWRAIEEQLIDVVQEHDGTILDAAAALRDGLFRGMGRAAPPVEERRFELAMVRLTGFLHDFSQQVLANPGNAAEFKIRVVERMADTLAIVSQRLESGLPPLTSSGHTLLRDHLHAHLFAKEFRGIGTLAGGIGAFILDTAVGRFIAGAEDGPIDAARLSSHLVPWIRFSTNPRVLMALRMAEEALIDLFIHNPGER